MNITDFKKEFQSKILLPSLTTGLIAAIVTISMEVPLAARNDTCYNSNTGRD
jgi:hypothetical protein